MTGPIPPTAAVISASELIRIKNQAVIKTEQEIQAEREEAQRIKDERDKLSKQRKDRMKELEKRAVLLAKKSDSEVAEIAKKQQIREAAEKQIDDSLDAIKLLKSMAARATAYSIRDQQLEEKKVCLHFITTNILRSLLPFVLLNSRELSIWRKKLTAVRTL